MKNISTNCVEHVDTKLTQQKPLESDLKRLNGRDKTMNGKTVIHLIFFLAPLLHVRSHGAAAARMERGALAGAQPAGRVGARRRLPTRAKARAATVVALVPSPARTSSRPGRAAT